VPHLRKGRREPHSADSGEAGTTLGGMAGCPPVRASSGTLLDHSVHRTWVWVSLAKPACNLQDRTGSRLASQRTGETPVGPHWFLRLPELGRGSVAALCHHAPDETLGMVGGSLIETMPTLPEICYP
jgi:hypothetical protein